MTTLQQGLLDPNLFNQLLSGPTSYRIAYLKANLCPNKSARGGHVMDCPVCKGGGFYWESVMAETETDQELTRAGVYEDSERLSGVPTRIVSVTDERGVSYPPDSVTVQEGGQVVWTGPQVPADYLLYTVRYASSHLRGAVQGVTTQREFATRGEYDTLDLQLTVDRYLADKKTPNPAFDAGEGDRFILLDTWRRHSQHLTRGVQDVCVYRRVRAVRLTSVLDGALHEWMPEADYSVVDGAVTWQPGNGPKVGTPYTLEGQVSPEYFVFQVLPQTRHADGLPLPRRFVLRGFEKHPSFKPDVRVEP